MKSYSWEKNGGRQRNDLGVSKYRCWERQKEYGGCFLVERETNRCKKDEGIILTGHARLFRVIKLPPSLEVQCVWRLLSWLQGMRDKNNGERTRKGKLSNGCEGKTFGKSKLQVSMLYKGNTRGLLF